MKKYILTALLWCLIGNAQAATIDAKNVVKEKELIAGEYKRYHNGKLDADQASIKIKKQQNGKFKVEGSAVWVGDIDSGDVNTGELDGTFMLEGNTIHYADSTAEDSCHLTLVFSKDALHVSGDTIYCGGLNVTFNGDYKKTQDNHSSSSATQLAHDFYHVFYTSYQKYMKSNQRSLENFKKIIAAQNYFSTTLSTLLINDERRQLANPGEITGLDFDPFTAAQDEVGKASIGEAKNEGAKTLIPVTFSLAGKHQIILEVTREKNSLVISNIFYPDDKTDLLKLLSKKTKVN